MSTLRTEEMTLNMGPQHPSTHGVLRFVVRADGEVMREAIPDVGYLHRSIEKIAEKVGYHGFMPYTDRVDYVCAMFTNQGWGMACEKLAHIEVPKRGEYCRVIAAEFNRIASHLLSVGTMGMDIGAMTPFTHAIREREMINDLIEELCGARLTFNYMRIGGVAWDLPPGWREKAIAYLDHLNPILDEFNSLLSFNKIYIERLANIGIITAEEAINYNLVGPNLRGCGIRWDIRKDIPYSVYPDFDFEVPIGTGKWGTLGDSMDRYMVRIHEMKESVKILRQALEHDSAGQRAGESAAQLQAARRRMPDSRRERARRHGMVRRERRHWVSVARPRAHRLICRDGHHAEVVAGFDDRGFGNADCKPGRDRAGDRSVALCRP